MSIETAVTAIEHELTRREERLYQKPSDNHDPDVNVTTIAAALGDVAETVGRARRRDVEPNEIRLALVRLGATVVAAIGMFDRARWTWRTDVDAHGNAASKNAPPEVDLGDIGMSALAARLADYATTAEGGLAAPGITPQRRETIETRVRTLALASAVVAAVDRREHSRCGDCAFWRPSDANPETGICKELNCHSPAYGTCWLYQKRA